MTVSHWMGCNDTRTLRSRISPSLQVCSQVGGQPTQNSGVFQPVEKPLGNARQTHLRANQGAGQNGARLILPAPVDRVEHGGFEIGAKAGGQVIRRFLTKTLPKWVGWISVAQSTIVKFLVDYGV